MFDFTHAPNSETFWKPIVRKRDPVPDNSLLNNKVQLKEWEMNLNNQFHANIYDRRVIDQDVLRRFRMQGGSIQMAIDYRDLTKDENFWKTEKDITRQAQNHIKELSKIIPFDSFKLSP